MSHVPLRVEKDCLNCGTIVQGRYCHVCGQENVVPKESFWHMVTHFFYDITHFDSSFFTTVKDLIFRPGFLSNEYISGRRVKYLHPIRMYVFTSAIFFLFFFSFFQPKGGIVRNTEDTSKPIPRSQAIEKQSGLIFDFTDNPYKTRKAYDSAQNLLPPAKKDGWFKRRLTHKEIDFREKYNENPNELMEKLGESILHRLPYMLLFSLPLFALILKLVYIRRRQFYYADHGVFTIHLYVFSFLILMGVSMLDRLDDIFHLDIFGWLMAALFIWLFIYLYKAMRNFYKQRRGKTIFKFMIVSLVSFLMMVVLFVAIMFFSAYTV